MIFCYATGKAITFFYSKYILYSNKLADIAACGIARMNNNH